MQARIALCCLTLSVLPLDAAASAPLSPSAPAIVMQAAQTAASESAGVIVHERHITVSAVAGPAHFSQSSDALMLMADGSYKQIHYLRMVENGRPVSTKDLTKLESKNNADLAQGDGVFKQPYDRHFLNDYQFAIVPCICNANEIDVRFTSALHDDQHGAGDMRIDESTGHVLGLTYVPYVLPDRANSGTVTETFGQALPGLWTIIRIDRTYGGRVFIVSGHGTVSEVLDHFHHFTDAETGEAFYRTAMTE